MDRERRLRQELHSVLARLSEAREPLDLVEDVPMLEDFADDFAQARIADARASGASWAEISERLGVTRQAAHKRFSGRRARFELRFIRDKNGG
jgi:hypothetical protein